MKGAWLHCEKLCGSSGTDLGFSFWLNMSFSMFRSTWFNFSAHVINLVDSLFSGMRKVLWQIDICKSYQAFKPEMRYDCDCHICRLHTFCQPKCEPRSNQQRKVIFRARSPGGTCPLSSQRSLPKEQLTAPDLPQIGPSCRHAIMQVVWHDGVEA